MSRPRPLTTRGFDSAACGMGRTLRLGLLAMALPLKRKGLGGGPGLGNLFALWALHAFGRIAFRAAAATALLGSRAVNFLARRCFRPRAACSAGLPAPRARRGSAG